jgi:hypothetical protein
MRLLAAAVLLAIAAPAVQAGEDPEQWPRWDGGKLGLRFKHPAGAKIAVHGDTVIIAGNGFAAVNIVVSPTELHGKSSMGGTDNGHVDFTLGVPMRAAHCTADSTDAKQLEIASWICASMELDPAPRKPHVQLSVTSSGLADEGAFERAVHVKGHLIDGCWIAALKNDPELPEGSLTMHRTYQQGAPTATELRIEDFFDHDAKTLGACVQQALKPVPVKSAADAAETTVKAIFLYY